MFSYLKIQAFCSDTGAKHMLATICTLRFCILFFFLEFVLKFKLNCSNQKACLIEIIQLIQFNNLLSV